MKQSGKNFIGITHYAEVGKLHHGAMWVGVDAHNVFGLAKATGVLHCTTHAKSYVQLRVHHNTCGSNLALVFYPAAVGNNTRRTNRGTEFFCNIEERMKRT
jgi:hypothetical protein